MRPWRRAGLPAVVAGFAGWGALGAERELTRTVAGVPGAGGVGLHQRGTRARDRLRVRPFFVGRGQGAIREIDRLLELTTMAVAVPGEGVGEPGRGCAREGVRVERGREVGRASHGLSLPPRRCVVERGSDPDASSGLARRTLREGSRTVLAGETEPTAGMATSAGEG
jgi:hypothetical protein